MLRFFGWGRGRKKQGEALVRELAGRGRIHFSANAAANLK